MAEPMRRVHAGGPTGLLGIGTGGGLWALPQSLASELDLASPMATGQAALALS